MAEPTGPRSVSIGWFGRPLSLWRAGIFFHVPLSLSECSVGGGFVVVVVVVVVTAAVVMIVIAVGAASPLFDVQVFVVGIVVAVAVFL